jgi:tetratricopeptide (TPR) repeat protein
MRACSHCGAPVSRLDAACSFCGAPNAQRETLTAEVEALIARGQQALNEGRPADAIEALARAVALEPEAFDAYFYMTAAWHQLGNTQRALDCMERARALRPGSAPIYYNTGMLLARSGERYRGRWNLWEALRLLMFERTLSSKKNMLDSIYEELALLGAITNEEIAQMQPLRDAQGHPHNPELTSCLREVSERTPPQLAIRLYIALARAFVLIPDDGGGQRDGVLRAAGESAQLAAVMVQGPDQRWYLPVFSDAAALSAFRTGAAYTALPGVSAARMANGDPKTAGLVLNPTAAGAGQPIERDMVAALAQGFVGRLRL